MKFASQFIVYVSFAIIAAVLGVASKILFGVQDVSSLALSLGFLMVSVGVYSAYVRSIERDRLNAQIAQLQRTVDSHARVVGGLSDDDGMSADDLLAEVKVLQTLLAQVTARKVGKQLSDTPPTRRIRISDQPTEAEGKVRQVDVGEIMRNALQENRIDLHLQPIVALPSRNTVHYECFSRVRDEDGTLLSPGEFMPVAEESGLIGGLDNLLLFRCIQLIRKLGMRRPKVRFFFNISSISLHDSDFFTQFLDFLELHRDLSDRLVFEMAQGDIEALGPDVERNLSSLGRQGFSFSMDQVTNLGFNPADLAARHFKYIKIDADLLLGGSADLAPQDFKELLARHNIELIAAKIEDEKTILDVLDLGATLAQGYLFGEPRPSRMPE
ncbi:MAG: EAL domain-containing protein [Sphingomonadales bacterium]|nr:EAL domain-containing protein [Sphingomonadales bacterium]